MLEAVSQMCSVKKMFSEILQNSQENTCSSCFPVNFTKFPRTPFLTEHLRWLLLECQGSYRSYFSLFVLSNYVCWISSPVSIAAHCMKSVQIRTFFPVRIWILFTYFYILVWIYRRLWPQTLEDLSHVFYFLQQKCLFYFICLFVFWFYVLISWLEIGPF